MVSRVLAPLALTCCRLFGLLALLSGAAFPLGLWHQLQVSFTSGFDIHLIIGGLFGLGLLILVILSLFQEKSRALALTVIPLAILLPILGLFQNTLLLMRFPVLAAHLPASHLVISFLHILLAIACISLAERMAAALRRQEDKKHDDK